MFAWTLKHPQGGDYTRQNVFQTWQKLTGFAWQMALHKFFIVYTEIIKFESSPEQSVRKIFQKEICLYVCFLSVYPSAFIKFEVLYKKIICVMLTKTQLNTKQKQNTGLIAIRP